MAGIQRLTLFLCLCLSLGAQAQETPNAKQARRIFDQVYQMVFGPEGSQLTYKVNIIRVRFGTKVRRVSLLTKSILRGTTM